MISVIRSEAQYAEILDRLAALIEADPIADSDEGRELEVLSLLVQDYERRAFPIAAPSPLAALRLRMEQQSLAPKDLVPFLGSRSKVSEVLSAKRPLSLGMIRALHSGLGIPLESLIAEELDDDPNQGLEWDRFPVREVVKRGWIQMAKTAKAHRLSYSDAKELMEEFFRPVGGPATTLGVLLKTDVVRTGRSSDRYALATWVGYVSRLAERRTVGRAFSTLDWDSERFKELRSLSRFDVGPRLAVEYLLDHGVIVVVEPHLKRTRLDGAALLRSDQTPVIGLTLRHDRLDNFWFTLFHELMHVIYHLRSAERGRPTQSCFIDDLDIAPGDSPLESEADTEARNALVPEAEWEASAARFAVAPETVAQLAREVGVSDAIVAGRVRFERKNYRLLSGMVGAGQVRVHFPEVAWQQESA